MIFLLLFFPWATADSEIRFRRQDFIDLTATDARCNNSLGQPGVCISIKQCPRLLNLLLTQRQQLKVANFLRTSVCGYEGLNPKVCCPSSNNEVTTQLPIQTTPILKKIDTNNDVRVNGDFPKGGECGTNNAQHTRVVNGLNASLGTWPWMAALGYKSSRGVSQPVFLCAGSLITNRHILTAAHCVTNKKTLLIARMGVINLYNDTEAEHFDGEVAKTVPHEEYNPVTFTNDIAIVVLKNPVSFTKLIKPICLPLTRELRSKDYSNRLPFTAGWGTLSYNGPGSATLQELQMPVVSEKECKRAFAPFKTAVIDRRVLCAGFLDGKGDACRGDSGGPLMDFNSKDKLFYQIGIVSYGYKCAEKGFPGIYTKVASFADWIDKKVQETQ